MYDVFRPICLVPFTTSQIINSNSAIEIENDAFDFFLNHIKIQFQFLAAKVNQ